MTAFAVTSELLVGLNLTAVRRGANRTFDSDNLVRAIDPDGFHILDPIMIHNDVEYRCRVLLKVIESDNPIMGWLDVSLDDWPKVQRADRAIREVVEDNE